MAEIFIPVAPKAMRVSSGTIRHWDRSDFVQVRATLGDRACAWLQVAPCTPPPDEKRDHRLIAHYLDPHTFLWWLRSLLSDSTIENAGGDWDLNSEDAPAFFAERLLANRYDRHAHRRGNPEILGGTPKLSATPTRK